LSWKIEKANAIPPLMKKTGKDNIDISTPSFGKLSKRITGITSNLLFTAIVVVAGLGLGRQVLIWWAADAPNPSAAAKNADLSFDLGDPAGLEFLSFGSQGWSMARREFHGSRADAEKQLARDCREQIEKAPTPRHEPTAEQKNLLASLAKTPAIDAELPRWQLFAPNSNRAMLVGIKPPLVQAAEQGSPPAGTSHIVLWGLALPQAVGEWSLLLFFPSVEGVAANPRLIDIPLPPECRKMLAVQGVNGGAMLTFSGPGDAESWRKFFDNWFAKQGWKPVFPWQSAAPAWYARYRGDYEGREIELSLQFRPDPKGGMTGLMISAEAKNP
jgi:hypothetical protein